MVDYLHPPQWQSARSIYQKLSDEFHVLTNAYKIELDTRTKLMLDHLILGIDEVDQCIDEIAAKKDRDDITSEILNFLNNESEFLSNPLIPKSLNEKMIVLKKIVNELNVQSRFHDAVAKIFDYTERKRHTKDQKELINFVQLEGQATAELPLSIMQVDTKHGFAKFFTQLCVMMGVADLVIDARSDFKANYIVVKPNLKMYWQLNKIMVSEGLKLIWGFPDKFKFLIYCIKFSFLLLTADD